ncbi:hypothetical protein G9A89_023877 [Geosiphon pyriformis]|nr:hypothetical protein G9A89_023877 [Geosiphon pyriformis]
MIYTIPEKDKPISSCASESESTFNPNSNSDNNNDKNKSSNVAQDGNENNNDSNSDTNLKTYIALSDLIKKQELKWFNNNNESIMLEHVHNTDAKFDLRYSEKDAIKLESHLHICIDLKIALKILATMITYIIEPNEKIAQAIFLFLVKIAQLVSMGNREKIGITARRIQSFGSMGRIDILVNMAEKKIVEKKEIISTCQSIFIPSYNQYMVIIEKKVKDQV